MSDFFDLGTGKEEKPNGKSENAEPLEESDSEENAEKEKIRKAAEAKKRKNAEKNVGDGKSDGDVHKKRLSSEIDAKVKAIEEKIGSIGDIQQKVQDLQSGQAVIKGQIDVIDKIKELILAANAKSQAVVDISHNDITNDALSAIISRIEKVEKMSVIDISNQILQIEDRMKVIENQPTPAVKGVIEIDENAFLLWIKGLDPLKYPICAGMINRVKTHKRKSFVLDMIQLINLYIGKK